MPLQPAPLRRRLPQVPCVVERRRRWSRTGRPGSSGSSGRPLVVSSMYPLLISDHLSLSSELLPWQQFRLRGRRPPRSCLAASGHRSRSRLLMRHWLCFRHRRRSCFVRPLPVSEYPSEVSGRRSVVLLASSMSHTWTGVCGSSSPSSLSGGGAPLPVFTVVSFTLLAFFFFLLFFFFPRARQSGQQ